MKGLGARSRFDPGLRFSFFLIETFSITGQFLRVLKMAATFMKRTTALATTFLETLSSNDVRYRKQNVMDPSPLFFNQ